MAEEKRVILFSTEPGLNQPTTAALRSAGFEIAVVSERSQLMREVRNARDRVVLLDFQSKDIDGLQLLREIKRLDGSVQIFVINAEPKLFAGIQIFRAGGEACFFKPAPSVAELRDALEGAFQKIARWWRALQEVAANRNPATETGASVAMVSGSATAIEPGQAGLYPSPDEEIEVVSHGACLKGKVITSSSAGMDFVMLGAQTPALLDSLFIRCRGVVNRGVVRRMSNHPSGGWRIGLEWSIPVGGASVSVGARAERALFVVLEGYHVVARSLVAVSKDVVSARLATGRVHAVATNAVLALTRSEREAELVAADDLSFFVDFYQLESLAGLGAIVEAILAIEFAIGEDVA
jgi:FixJ family two-component response regulator